MRDRVYQSKNSISKASGLIRNITMYFLAGITLLVLCSLSVYMVSLSAGQSSTDREELRNEEKMLYAWVNVNIVDTVTVVLSKSLVPLLSITVKTTSYMPGSLYA